MWIIVAYPQPNLMAFVLFLILHCFVFELESKLFDNELGPCIMPKYTKRKHIRDGSRITGQMQKKEILVNICEPTQ